MTETIAMPKTSFSSILDNNKNELARIDTYKKEKISATPRNLAFAGMAVGGVIITGMIAAQIVAGIFALGLLAVVGVGGFFGLRWLRAIDPVVKQKTKNAQLKWMMDEARKNAIYQLDNKVIDNAERLIQARAARDEIGGQIELLKRKINPANKGKPMYETKMRTVEKLEEAYSQVKTNLDKAAKSNEEFKVKVQDYKDMEAFTQAAGKVQAAFGETAGSALEDMLSLAAFDHIDSEFSTALISIENSALDMTTDGGN